MRRRLPYPCQVCKRQFLEPMFRLFDLQLANAVSTMLRAFAMQSATTNQPRLFHTTYETLAGKPISTSGPQVYSLTTISHTSSRILLLLSFQPLREIHYRMPTDYHADAALGSRSHPLQATLISTFLARFRFGSRWKPVTYTALTATLRNSQSSLRRFRLRLPRKTRLPPPQESGSRSTLSLCRSN